MSDDSKKPKAPLLGKGGRLNLGLDGPSLRLPNESSPVSKRPDEMKTKRRSAPPPRRESLPVEANLEADMRSCFALDDLTGALRAAELLLGQEPNHADALAIAKAATENLSGRYRSKLGSMERVPSMAVSQSELRWLGLDHRAGFLLSRIDGVATIQQVLDMSGLSELEGLKTLSELYKQGVIALK